MLHSIAALSSVVNVINIGVVMQNGLQGVYLVPKNEAVTCKILRLDTLQVIWNV